VTHTLYDLGLKDPQDGRFLYRGESDASFEENLKRTRQDKHCDKHCTDSMEKSGVRF
jgi:hypothetical protein